MTRAELQAIRDGLTREYNLPPGGWRIWAMNAADFARDATAPLEALKGGAYRELNAHRLALGVAGAEVYGALTRDDEWLQCLIEDLRPR